MKKITYVLFGILLTVCVLSCRLTNHRQNVFTQLSSLTVIIQNIDNTVITPVSGELVKIPSKIEKEANLGKYVAVKTQHTYIFDKKKETAEFYVITGNLSKIEKKRGEIEKGSLVGLSTTNIAYTVIMSDTLNSYLVFATNTKPEYHFGKWWFNADLLFSQNTTTLPDYEPVTSVQTAFEAMKGGGINNHYRFQEIFPDNSEKISPELQDELSAYREARSGMEIFESMNRKTINGITYIYIWPPSYTQFKQVENITSQPLWIFGTFIPSDINPAEVYIFSKEFYLEPLETMYKTRIWQIMTDTKTAG